MSMLSLFSPAKINLFLRVVSKRPDGYHNLSSLFQTIDLGDTLNFTLSTTDDHLTCNTPKVPIDASNLILKATSLFRHKTGLNSSFNIHLEKNIPMQAGLGGGSSNAATTLWACNQLTHANISVEVLQEWGLELGSDVPFFFSQGTAHCTSRGEVVQPIESYSPDRVFIVKPHQGLSTPEVFRRLKLESPLENAEKIDLEATQNQSYHYFNDLEKPAFEILPELRSLKNFLLNQGFDAVLMSGSGSAFFCLGAGTLEKIPHTTLFESKFIKRNPFEWYLESLN